MIIVVGSAALAVILIGVFVFVRVTSREYPAHQQPTATINGASLISSSRNPVISGAASNIRSLRVNVRSISSEIGSAKEGSWESTSPDVPVIDGRWSVLAASELAPSRLLDEGVYGVTVFSEPDLQVLAKSTLVILGERVVPAGGTGVPSYYVDFPEEEADPSALVREATMLLSNRSSAHGNVTGRDALGDQTIRAPFFESSDPLLDSTAETAAQENGMLSAPSLVGKASQKDMTASNQSPACTMTVRPANIAPGQSASISWWSTNASTISITRIGSVGASGSIVVAPSVSTTYTGTFAGGGGTALCSATITVDSTADPTTSSSERIGVDTSAPDSACGLALDLDIALVIDSSGSISSDELVQMKNAFSGFVDEFLPAHPTMFSVVEFDYQAAVRQSFTGNTAQIKSAIQSAARGGATNWEDALQKAKSTFDPRPNVPDLIIFTSDGNPTVNNNSYSTGGMTDGKDLTNAVAVADSIKAAGIRVITLGIGYEKGIAGFNELNPDNLKAISSPNSYYNASTFGELPATLGTISKNLCSSSSQCASGVCAVTSGNCPSPISRCGIGNDADTLYLRTYSGSQCSATEEVYRCAGGCTGGACNATSGGCPAASSHCGTGTNADVLISRSYSGLQCSPHEEMYLCEWGCTSNRCASRPPPPVASLTVEPTLVRSGNTVAVSWTSKNVRSCNVSASNGDAWSGTTGVGKISKQIVGETLYTLRCIGLDRTSISETEIVKIIPAFQER